MQNLFFRWRMFGTECYLKRLFHTMVKLRQFGSQAHMARGYQLCGVGFSDKGGALVSQGAESF